MSYHLKTYYKDCGRLRDELQTDNTETVQQFVKDAAQAGLRVTVECPVDWEGEKDFYMEDHPDGSYPSGKEEYLHITDQPKREAS